MKRQISKVISIDELESIIKNTPMISPGLPVGSDQILENIEAERVFANITKKYPKSRLVETHQDTSYYARIVVPYLQETSTSRMPTVILSMIGGLFTIQDYQFLIPEFYDDIVNILVSSEKRFVPYDLFGPYEVNYLGWDGSPCVGVKFTHEDLWRSLFDFI